MGAYIALLRAVNLAAHNKIGMSALRAVLEATGFGDVRTVLQSGNVVFTSSRRSAASLERASERTLQARLGIETDVFVRSADEWGDIIAANPFPAQARNDPAHLVVALLKTAADDRNAEHLRGAISGRERVEVDGRVAYIIYPDGIGRSRLTTAIIERHLDTSVTGRNWNTVLKLAALAKEVG
jgi:uncharacterized protein (DUF1697 family)